jgi:DNA transformation protein
MAVSKDFRLYVEDLLAPVGPVNIRAMFGGAGVYAGGVMFALIADEVLYFKADSETEADFLACGCEPFTYAGKGKPIRMSYWRVPESLFDDPGELSVWGRKAQAAAVRAKRPSKPSKR